MTQNSAFLFGYTNIIANGAIILITIFNIVVYKFRKLQEEEVMKQKNNLLLSLSTRRSCYRFSFDEMKQATSNFHDKLVIGKGGFGYVYKGTLALGPTLVAIKRFNSMSNQGSTEFRAEIEILSKVRHSHLVSLIGYCDEGCEMILVYEFMPGGTLADHLHKRVRQGDTSLPPLSWVQRLKICIGAARGLHYCHTGTGIQHRTIHRDVKTTNILLDENYAAKISDFGISKASPANQATTPTNNLLDENYAAKISDFGLSTISPENQATTYVSTRVKGTFGYLDPYYFQTERLTWRSDVYSFGVVLFEVLCGRPAVDMTLEREQIGLAGWAQHCFQEGILGQIIDPRMMEEACPDSVEAFVKVAIQCIDIRPKHRPTMAEVEVGLEFALASQERSTEYCLPDIIPSDDNEKEIENYECGKDDLASNRHQEKKSSAMAEVVVGLESALASQERSTEYCLPEIIPSDDNEEEIDMSELETGNQNYEYGKDALASKRHQEKKSSAMKRFVAFLAATAQTKSANREAKTARNSGVLEATSKLKFYTFKELSVATRNFHPDGVLRQNGWHIIHKGLMPTGQEVAVNKLSLGPRQGLREFLNEVNLLLKVQHKNLVMLLGCCVEGPEKMLVYEYLKNKSLDYFLFDKRKSSSLNWTTRFQIITGVVRGLLYLHEEAPVRIIHQDIKASNILLDEQLNPKISDFGLAKLFPRNDTHLDRFRNISGTRGYMAPEFALLGYLSVKTDVFSFGVLLLEIVSGRKSLDRLLGSEKADLLTYAWELFQANKTMELIDTSLKEFNPEEAAMCIQLGLLCCQASVSERPDMNSLYRTLSSDSFTLPKPGRPGILGHAEHWTTTSFTALTKMH